jgi:hypothetical protein
LLGEKIYRITFPHYFRVVVHINGVRFPLDQLADMKCNTKWCTYVFGDYTLNNLISSDCSVRIVKYYTGYTVEQTMACREFISLIKELNEG